MKTDEELGVIPKEELERRFISLQQIVNPKPPKEAVEVIKQELRKLKKL